MLSSITISTTMRSFLPNHPLIDALKCCGNPDCNKKEAEAEDEAEDEAERLMPLDIMCPGCRSVYYCTVNCQKIHNKHHQQQCNEEAEKRTDGWKHNQNKENTDNDDDDDDDQWFQAIPPKEDCPICTLSLPVVANGIPGSVYFPCCGTLMCVGCEKENYRLTLERKLDPCCAFCREPNPTSGNAHVIRMKKRMEKNDSAAFL